MERYLKQYFWTLWLAFIALSAFLGMRAVNVFVGAAIEPEPAFLVDAGPVRRALPGALAARLDVERFGRLFGIEPPPPPEDAEKTAAEEAAELAGLPSDVCWDCKPVKSSLRLQLLGTMVANESRWSTALISDLDVQTTGVFVHGDELKPKKAIVFQIQREPQRVIIINEDTRRLEYIDAVPGDGKTALTGLGNLGTAAVPPPDSDPDGETDGVSQISDNEYVITQEKLDSTLADLNTVATQARIVPSFKNGVANGFKLFSIRPGSIYSSIGIQNGDVITRINGFEINSPDKALELYQRLRDARNLEIDIERRGQPMKKRYSIQ